MTNKVKNDDDPRLDDLEKYWLQLTSYDLDKLFNKSGKVFIMEAKPTKDGFKSLEPALPDPFQEASLTQ